jgi:hypothetical protein
MGPGASLDTVGEEKNVLPLPGIELRPVAIPTELSLFILF